MRTAERTMPPRQKGVWHARGTARVNATEPSWGERRAGHSRHACIWL